MHKLEKYYKKINGYFNKQQYYKAKLLLNKCLKYEINQGKIYVLLGWLYDQWALKSKRNDIKKKYQKIARKYFRLAYGAKETKLDAVRGMATVQMHQSNYIKALKNYKKAYSIKKDFSTYNDLGNIYQKLGKYNRALTYYNKALLLSRNKEEEIIPLYNLLIINQRLNNKREINKYSKRLNLLSKKFNLARILKKQSKNNNTKSEE